MTAVHDLSPCYHMVRGGCGQVVINGEKDVWATKKQSFDRLAVSVSDESDLVLSSNSQ